MTRKPRALRRSKAPGFLDRLLQKTSLGGRGEVTDLLLRPQAPKPSTASSQDPQGLEAVVGSGRRAILPVEKAAVSVAPPVAVAGSSSGAVLPGLGAAPAIANRPSRPGKPATAQEPPSEPLLGSLNLTPDGEDAGEEQFQSEISAAVSVGGRQFLVSSGGGSTLQLTEATDPTSPTLIGRTALGAYTSTSVATYGNLVAVALTPADYNAATSLDQMRGLVRFYRVQPDGALTFLQDVAVGYLPDGMAFNANGTQLVIANEGQPNWGEPDGTGQYPDAYSVDPNGSIGIIDIRGRVNLSFSYTDLGFQGVDLPADLRISGPAGTTAAQDIEPEYVSILGNYAYVTLQENNGVAKVNLANRQIEAVFALGTVNYSQQAVDLTDRDGGFKPLIGQTIDGQDILGLRMPDGLSAFRIQGKDYFITANEGDGRVYADLDDVDPVYEDEQRTGPDGSSNRLKTLTDATVPTAFGGRSVSIFDGDTGALLWDSGNSLQTIAFAAGTYADSRSDDKGVEPETVITTQIDGRTYAVVGLERGTQSTLVVFDISDPTNGQYVSHKVIEGSLSPEGLLLISAKDSPTGRPQLVVSNEVSNTVDLLDFQALLENPGPGAAGVFAATMLKDVAGGPELQVSNLFTNGEFTNGLEPGDSVYAPTGILDGLGAYDNGDGTYTVLANSELNRGTGTPYLVGDVALNGARIHKLIVDKDTDDDASNGYQSAVIAGGIAYSRIIDANGNLVVAADQIGGGFNRFCSSSYEMANRFGAGHGFVDAIYLTGEEADEGLFYALDTASDTLYALPGLGRGGWETAVQVDTGSTNTVGVLLMDDNTAPLYLWLGSKSADPTAGFLERNGLAASQGNVYTWVPTAGSIGTAAGQVEQDYTDDGVANPVAVPDSADLNALPLGTAAAGSWQLVGSGTEVAGWDESTLRNNANALGALQLSRLEDASINPTDGQEVVFATTGNSAFGGGDTFGNLITLDLGGAFNSEGLIEPGNSTDLEVIYDGDREIAGWDFQNGDNDGVIDAGQEGAFGATIIRNPDNLTWAEDGSIYVQEDRSVSSAYFSEEETSIWKVSPTEKTTATDPITGLPSGQAETERWAQIDRTAVPTSGGQTDPSASDPGNWESSGIIDVSTIYDQAAGSTFLSDVQAHSLRNGSIGGNANLVQGGQLNLIQETPLL